MIRHHSIAAAARGSENISNMGVRGMVTCDQSVADTNTGWV